MMRQLRPGIPRGTSFIGVFQLQLFMPKRSNAMAVLILTFHAMQYALRSNYEGDEGMIRVAWPLMQKINFATFRPLLWLRMFGNILYKAWNTCLSHLHGIEVFSDPLGKKSWSLKSTLQDCQADATYTKNDTYFWNCLSIEEKSDVILLGPVLRHRTMRTTFSWTHTCMCSGLP